MVYLAGDSPINPDPEGDVNKEGSAALYHEM
jgi:hypothetical protein